MNLTAFKRCKSISQKKESSPSATPLLSATVPRADSLRWRTIRDMDSSVLQVRSILPLSKRHFVSENKFSQKCSKSFNFLSWTAQKSVEDTAEGSSTTWHHNMNQRMKIEPVKINQSNRFISPPFSQSQTRPVIWSRLSRSVSREGCLFLQV